MIQYEIRIIPDRTAPKENKWLSYLPEIPTVRAEGPTPIDSLNELYEVFNFYRESIKPCSFGEIFIKPTGMSDEEYQAWKESLSSMNS